MYITAQHLPETTPLLVYPLPPQPAVILASTAGCFHVCMYTIPLLLAAAAADTLCAPLVHHLGRAALVLGESQAVATLETISTVLISLTVAGPVQDALGLVHVPLTSHHTRPQLGLVHFLGVILVLDVNHLLELVSKLGGEGAPA